MNRQLTAWAMVLAGMGGCASATAQDPANCRPVVGQTEIDGVVQQVTGTACLQPDGTWQMVGGDVYVGPPDYVDNTWYWWPAGVAFGSVIFIDRFHHAHHMHHVFFHGGRGFADGRGGFHGGIHHGGHDGGGGHGGHDGGSHH